MAGIVSELERMHELADALMVDALPNDVS
jgi:hypothetical protein